MASNDISAKPTSMHSILYRRKCGSASSRGMTSIMATYRNVPLASALSAAPPLLSDTCAMRGAHALSVVVCVRACTLDALRTSCVRFEWESARPQAHGQAGRTPAALTELSA